MPTDPVVVFEIVSPSSSRTDRFVIAREYSNTASIQRYIILEQSSQSATVFTRMNGVWVSTILVGEADADMPEIGITVPLAELHADVELPAEELEA
jgi:Uma2 family endonuclease